MERLEQMADFFAARVEMYDEHMLCEVDGCKEGYLKMADFVPESTKRLLDLGCGTGLELDAIFRKIPDLSVTGIDLCEEMLLKCKEKYADKSINLICGDYFTEPFGGDFDCAVSFQTMHHFSHERKARLYKKLFDALTPDGIYIECDYMVLTDEEEKHWFSQNSKIRQLQGIDENEFFHYDTPCTVDNQIKLLRQAGFSVVKTVMRIENTTMLVARKVK